MATSRLYYPVEDLLQMTYIYIYVYIYIYIEISCNTAARGLTDIYAQFLEWAAPKGQCGYISKTPCYNIYVTISIVMCCIAHSQRGIIMLHVRYYTVIRCYSIGITFQKLRKRCDGWKHKRWCCSDSPAFVHIKKLESTLISCLYQHLNI